MDDNKYIINIDALEIDIMEKNILKKNTPNKNKSVKNIKYIHFNTIKDCNAFLNEIDKTKYKISHFCCQNHGVGLLNINDNELREIEEKFLQ